MNRTVFHFARAGLIVGLPLLSGCGSIPKGIAKPESLPLPIAGEGILADVADDLLAGLPAEESLFLLLPNNVEALSARLALIDQARDHIDIQYFIWTNDECGRLLLDHLREAAARGVRVRILVDDLPVSGSDKAMAALAQTPNIELRLFNPKKLRRGTVGPLMEMVVYFRELNQRMHNKAFLVDGRWAVLGGRNVGNPYFGFGDSYSFKDLDVLMTGPIVAEVNNAFQRYWESEPAFPAEYLHKGVLDEYRAKRLAKFDARIAEDADFFTDSGLLTGREAWAAVLDRFRAEADRGVAVYLQDHPVVRGDRGTRLVEKTEAFTVTTSDEAVVVSPYFIIPKAAIERWREAQERGIRIQVVTGSLGANNHTLAHSHYRKYRKRFLDAGLNLYEFHHDPSPDLRRDIEAPGRPPGDVCLHVKAFCFDRRLLALGSLNLDPRAMKINTENLILIDSPALAEEWLGHVDRMLAPGNAWDVDYGPSGRIQWVSGDNTRITQPSRYFGQRLLDFFFRWLPIEGQL